MGWTSVALTQFGHSNFRSTHTVSFIIPSVIPDDAKEVLVYVHFHAGTTGPTALNNFKIYTEKEGNRYEKYVGLFSYAPQNAVNSNSDNLWFPMPPNRRVYLTAPRALDRHTAGYLYAIGYR